MLVENASEQGLVDLKDQKVRKSRGGYAAGSRARDLEVRRLIHDMNMTPDRGRVSSVLLEGVVVVPDDMV